MEPIGLVGTLIAIVQVSAKLTSLCIEYRSSVKDGPEDISRLSSETRSLTIILERLVRVANTDGSSDTSPSLRALKAESDIITTCLSDLKALSGSLEHEKQSMSRIRALRWPIKKKDVERSLEHIAKAKSALQLALAADTSSNVLQILAQTKQLSIKAKMDQLEDDALLHHILDWLPSVDCYSKHQRILQQKAPGTGAWLLQTAEYRMWKENRHSVMWLNGIPGCGKTVLCSTVIEDLQAHCLGNPQEVLLYFHFDSISHETASDETIVGTFMAQMVYQLGGVWTGLRNIHQNSKQYLPGSSPSSMRSWGKNLKSLVGPDAIFSELCEVLASYKTAHIVIDALDECHEDHLDRVFDLIQQFASRQVPSAHVFISSRIKTGIRDGLEPIDSVNLTIQETNIRDDIEVFVRHRLASNPRLLKWPEAFRSEVAQQLICQAGAMFQWAECQLKTLATCRNPASARATLQNCPRSLEELYARILSNIPDSDSDMARESLRWLSFSNRPLRLSELADAIAIRHQQDDSSIFDPELKLWDIQETLDICAGLITISTLSENGSVVDGSTLVKLAHYSVKEFLIADASKTAALSTYAMESLLSHSRLTSSCLAYMIHAGQVEDATSLPLLEYAARNWMAHQTSSVPAAASPEHASESPDLHSFLLSGTAFDIWKEIYNFEKPWIRARQQSTWMQNLVPTAVSSITPLYCAAYLGLERTCAELISRGARIDDKAGHLGCAMNAAAYRGHVGIVKLFIDAGADVNKKYKRFIPTAVMAAVKGGHEDVTKLLLESGALPQTNTEKQIGFDRPGDCLFIAAGKGHLNICKMLIAYGAHDYPVLKSRYTTCVELALKLEHVDVAAEIMSRGRHPHSPLPDGDFIFRILEKCNGRGGAASSNDYKNLFKNYDMSGEVSDEISLARATCVGDEETVHEVLQRLETLHSAYSSDLHTALAAVNTGNIPILKSILARLDNPEQVAWKAASSRNLEILDFILKEAALKLKDGSWERILCSACKVPDNLRMIGHLIDKMADFDAAATEALIAAAGSGAADAFHELLRRGAFVSEDPKDRIHLIAATAAGGNLDILSTLANRGLWPDGKDLCDDESRCTGRHDPFLAAVRKSRTDMALAVLDAGWDINGGMRRNIPGFPVNNKYWNPLAQALEHNNEVLAIELIKRGAKPEWEDAPGDSDYQETPLVSAITSDKDLVVSCLLEHGADPNRASQQYYRAHSLPPLHYAASEGRLLLVRKLIAYGADVNAMSTGGYTALHTAAKAGGADIVKALLHEYAADATARLENGSLATHSAAAMGHVKCLQVLLDFGMNIDDTNYEGRTPLHFAAESRHWSCVRLLLDRGADKAVRAGEEELTALDMARLSLEGMNKYNFNYSDNADEEKMAEELLARLEVSL